MMGLTSQPLSITWISVYSLYVVTDVHARACTATYVSSLVGVRLLT
jgi:hypothetical protein